MSFSLVEAVFEHSRATGVRRLVLLALAEHVNEERFTATGDTTAWPSQATLSRMVNTGERNVRHALEALLNAGEIERTGRKVGRGCIAYEIVLPKDPLPRKISSTRKESSTRKKRSTRKESAQPRKKCSSPPRKICSREPEEEPDSKNQATAGRRRRFSDVEDLGEEKAAPSYGLTSGDGAAESEAVNWTARFGLQESNGVCTPTPPVEDWDEASPQDEVEIQRLAEKFGMAS